MILCVEALEKRLRYRDILDTFLNEIGHCKLISEFRSELLSVWKICSGRICCRSWCKETKEVEMKHGTKSICLCLDEVSLILSECKLALVNVVDMLDDLVDVGNY